MENRREERVRRGERGEGEANPCGEQKGGESEARRGSEGREGAQVLRPLTPTLPWLLALLWHSLNHTFHSQNPTLHFSLIMAHTKPNNSLAKKKQGEKRGERD